MSTDGLYVIEDPSSMFHWLISWGTAMLPVICFEKKRNWQQNASYLVYALFDNSPVSIVNVFISTLHKWMSDNILD